MAAPLNRQTILVTGASGFIGRALTANLGSMGYDVLAIARTPLPSGTNMRSVELTTYCDGNGLSQLAEGVDAVIHLAAIAHRKMTGTTSEITAAFSANIDATRAVAAASAAAGVKRFILISSIGVNGNETRAQPFSESDTPNPSEPYALSKWQCELALREVVADNPGMEFVIIRPPLVYGPQAPGNFAQLARAVLKGMPLPLGLAQNLRSFIGLDNLLSLIELCVRHPLARNQVFLASDGEDVSMADFIRHLGLALGRPARLLNVPPPLVRALAQCLGRSAQAERLLAPLQIDNRKARTLLGWAPPLTLSEGLRRAAAPTASGQVQP